MRNSDNHAEGQTGLDGQPPAEGALAVESPPQLEAQTLTPMPEQFAAPRSTGVTVEIVMESYRVKGELHAPGIPRRLVDILNSNDLAFFTMYSGALDDPFNPETDAREFDLIQVDRNGILFAAPRGEVQAPDPFEVVRKKRVPSTIVMPGYRITGDLHLMPDADPALVTVISDHHFVPLTNATVLARGRSEEWQEPLLIVNMRRAFFFGTRKAAF
jgi:hypothetical protein